MCYGDGMDVLKMLEAAEADLAQAKARFDERQHLWMESQVEVTRKTGIVASLKDAIQLYGSDEGHAQLVAVEVSNGFDWSALTRGDTIVRLLTETGPLGPAEITRRLTEHGRQSDNPAKVSNALAEQRKRGKVETAGAGRWRATEKLPDSHEYDEQMMIEIAENRKEAV